MTVVLKCECGACRLCKKRVAQREYRQRNLDAERERDRRRNGSPARLAAQRARERGKPQTEAERRWAQENRERTNAARAAWKRRNPEKIRAQCLLAYHVRVGNVERQPCEVCGNARSEGHHADYSKPLAVRWLCRQHHAEVHRKVAA